MVWWCIILKNNCKAQMCFASDRALHHPRRQNFHLSSLHILIYTHIQDIYMYHILLLSPASVDFKLRLVVPCPILFDHRVHFSKTIRILVELVRLCVHRRRESHALVSAHILALESSVNCFEQESSILAVDVRKDRAPIGLVVAVHVAN